jgi:hypothetical protein
MRSALILLLVTGATSAASARPTEYSWCLQNYTSGVTECSYSSQRQCAESAAGGLGECVANAHSTLNRAH